MLRRLWNGLSGPAGCRPFVPAQGDGSSGHPTLSWGQRVAACSKLAPSPWRRYVRTAEATRSDRRRRWRLRFARAAITHTVTVQLIVNLTESASLSPDDRIRKDQIRAAVDPSRRIRAYTTTAAPPTMGSSRRWAMRQELNASQGCRTGIFHSSFAGRSSTAPTAEPRDPKRSSLTANQGSNLMTSWGMLRLSPRSPRCWSAYSENF